MDTSRADEPTALAAPWAAPVAPANPEHGVGPVAPMHLADSVYQTPPPGYSAAPGYGQPFGQPPSGYSAPPPRTNALPMASMITGAVALVIGNAISIGVLGVLGGIAGIVLGIVGLLRVRRRGVGSSGLASGGIAVSALSVLVGVLIFAAGMPAFMEGFSDGWERGMREAEEQSTDRGVDPAVDSPIADPDAQLPAVGQPIPAEWMNPDGPWLGIPDSALGVDQPSTISDFTVTVLSIDMAADAEVLAAHPRNPFPYGQYILVKLSVRNTSVIARDPLDHLMVLFPGRDDYIYDETGCGAMTARPVAGVGPLELNEVAEYEVCLDVPSYAIGEPRVIVYDFSGKYLDVAMWTAE